MSGGLSHRLLSALQLTRMALVFTAIADASAALLLWADQHAGANDSYRIYITPRHTLCAVLVSVGLYGYGMSLNDIIDRRRDQQIAADRPLPSGRIGLLSAHFICAALGALAIIAGLNLAQFPNSGVLSLILLVWTGALITFYDFAGKYLVAPGLLTLGLVRFFHATIPAPQLPLLWHPLLLLNHVAIISTIAYAWEQKRPALTRIHWWTVLGGLGVADLMCILLVYVRRHERMGGFAASLEVEKGLLLPVAAVAGFILLAMLIRFRSADIRSAGRNLMLAGLLWLIVYDASFVAGYVDWIPAVVLLLLLPVAYLSVLLMRWWAKLLLLSQKPEYQRAR